MGAGCVQLVSRHRWLAITLVYSAGVIVADLAGGRGQGVLGLLAISPILLSFEWGWRRTAAAALVPLVVVATDLFGHDRPALHAWAYRTVFVLAGALLGVYAAAYRQQRQAALIAAQELAEVERRRRQSAEAGVRTHAAAAALAGAVTVPEVLTAMSEHAVRWLGGRSIGVWFLDPDEEALRFGGGIGYALGVPDELAVVPAGSDQPVAAVLRDTSALLAPGIGAVPGSTVVLRLETRGRVLGSLAIGYPGDAVEPGQLTTLAAVAGQCALALDRARLFEAERRARATLQFLSEGTELMVSALEPDEVIRRLVRLAVPRLAEWCAVYIAEGGSFRRVAAAAAGRPDIEQVLDAHDPVATDPALAAAFATGTLHPLRPDPATMGVRSGVAVPIEAAGERIGVMTVGYPDDHDPRADLYALTGLAGRAGIALDNARQFRRQSDVAETLTAALLPSRLPTLASLSFSARYIPASGGVCGDWYDAEALADGPVVFGIGDAPGHGLPAASTMAELRNGARSLAAAGMSPAEILRHLSTLISTTDPAKIATALYVRLDPGSGTGSWASAGHLPPLVVTPDGQATYLGEPTLPLGASDRPEYRDLPLRLEPMSTLVIVSDGVVERRDESLDRGLEGLRQTVEEAAGRTPEGLASRIVDRFCKQPTDDCSILIARYLG